MAVVRRAERQVGIAALPGVRKQAAETDRSMGVELSYAQGQTGAVISNVGARAAAIGISTFGDIIAKEREKADKTALLEVSNKLAAWKTRKLYDPQTGVLLRKGKNAQGIPDELRTEYEQLTGELVKTLHTDRQRQAFDTLRSNEWQSLDLVALRHVSNEMQTYQAGELQAKVENSVQAGILAYRDPKLVAVELAGAVDALRQNLPDLGKGPEEIEKTIRAVQTKTHIGVINNLIGAEMDQQASAYFEAVQGQIEGDDLARVKATLEEGSITGDSQRLFDEIQAGGGTLEERRNKAKAIKDPKRRDATLARVEREGAFEEKAERDARENRFREAYDTVEKTKDVDKIPREIWSQFNGNERAALKNYTDDLIIGRATQTDLGTYYSFLNMIYADPEKFAKVGLLEYRHLLSKEDFKQVAGWQLDVRQGGDKAALKPDLEGFRTNAQILEDTLVQNGVDPAAKYDTPQGKAVAQIRRMLDRRVAFLQAAHKDPTTGKIIPGRKVTETEIQAELDLIMSATSNESGQPVSWWSLVRPDKYDWKDRTRRLIDYTIADVPLATRRQLEKTLKERGTPINDSTVLDAFITAELARQRR
jgi:hypothetical protein